jgi:hypothetical protein
MRSIKKPSLTEGGVAMNPSPFHALIGMLTNATNPQHHT